VRWLLPTLVAFACLTAVAVARPYGPVAHNPANRLASKPSGGSCAASGSRATA